MKGRSKGEFFLYHLNYCVIVGVYVTICLCVHCFYMCLCTGEIYHGICIELKYGTSIF